MTLRPGPCCLVHHVALAAAKLHVETVAHKPIGRPSGVRCCTGHDRVWQQHECTNWHHAQRQHCAGRGSHARMRHRVAPGPHPPGPCRTTASRPGRIGTAWIRTGQASTLGKPCSMRIRWMTTTTKEMRTGLASPHRSGGVLISSHRCAPLASAPHRLSRRQLREGPLASALVRRIRRIARRRCAMLGLPSPSPLTAAATLLMPIGSAALHATRSCVSPSTQACAMCTLISPLRKSTRYPPAPATKMAGAASP